MLVPTFTTQRLILKEITIEDATSYEENFVDYEVIRNLHKTVPWPYPKGGVKDFIQNNILLNQGRDQWNWGIYLKSDPSRLIGGIELWREARPDNRGFWLGKKFWGQGIMSEAVNPIMDFAFNKLGFEKLIFSNALGNIASRKIKEKTGATLIRIESGEFVDPLFIKREIWELSKPRWNELFLNELLIKARQYGCEYQNGLSNHLPMALISLNRIGADQKKLSEFYNEYIQILEIPTYCDTSITIKNWDQYLGHFKFNLEYREFFLNELSKYGLTKTLKLYLPKLIAGVSGGAFHPLIRLSYAIEIDSQWEVAESLAAWCMAYQELAEISIRSQSSVPPLDQLNLLSEHVRRYPMTIKGETVFEYFKCASNSKAFKNFVSSEIAHVSLSEIADVAIKLYLSTEDSFTALHCVTATHAARIVSQFYKDIQFEQYLWQAICAAYVVIKCTPISRISSMDVLPTWEDIFSKTREHKNDHVIKLVYTASCENHYYQNPLYQLAAAKKSGLKP